MSSGVNFFSNFQFLPASYNPYRRCIYLPYRRCEWGNVGVGSYVYASNPMLLKYELVCRSPNYFECDIDSLLAQHEGVSNWYEGFSKLSSSLVEWLKENHQRQRVSTKYFKALDMVLANALVAANSNAQLLVPKRTKSEIKRNVQNIGYKVVQDVLCFLTAKGLLLCVSGISSQHERGATWYTPTKTLVQRLMHYAVSPRLHPETLYLDYKVYDSNVGKWEVTKLPSEYMSTALELHSPAKRYNELMFCHEVSLGELSIIPYIYRVFNGSLELGGRFYGQFQNMERGERSKIMIDGERTIEPDFTALHLNLLYAKEGVQLINDPYIIEGYERDTIKSVILRMFNSKSRSRFVSQITKSGNPITKQEKVEHDKLARVVKDAGGKPFETRNKFKGFIENIPDGQIGEELVEAIENAHPSISKYFFTNNLGLRLQYLDSQIIAGVIDQLVLDNIPFLPVHDSIRCKESDLNRVVEVMLKQYNEKSCFDIEISL